MTVRDFVRPFFDWKFSFFLLMCAVCVVAANSAVILWVEAGPPANVLVQQSTMAAVPAGRILTIAVLRDTRRTDCVTTTTRSIIRQGEPYALTPEMRKAAPNLPAVIMSPMTYPIPGGAIPQVTQGLGVTRFGVEIPNGVPPGHYIYRATIKSICPLIPTRDSTYKSPDVPFDVAASVDGASVSAQ